MRIHGIVRDDHPRVATRGWEGHARNFRAAIVKLLDHLITIVWYVVSDKALVGDDEPAVSARGRESDRSYGQAILDEASKWGETHRWNAFRRIDTIWRDDDPTPAR